MAESVPLSNDHSASPRYDPSFRRNQQQQGGIFYGRGGNNNGHYQQAHQKK